MIARQSRREMPQSVFGGIGSVGLAGMLAREQAEAVIVGRYKEPLTSGKAKHVISLFLAGGPSHVDMFDPKPDLVKFQGSAPDQ
ncbi:MAG: DUF1501 domain-containing protein [Bryobacteraceae bacterium]